MDRHPVETGRGDGIGKIRVGRKGTPMAAACAQPRILALVETKVLSVPPKFIMESMMRPDSQSVTKMVSLSRLLSSSMPRRSMLIDEPLSRSLRVSARILAVPAMQSPIM